MQNTDTTNRREGICRREIPHSAQNGLRSDTGRRWEIPQRGGRDSLGSDMGVPLIVPARFAKRITEALVRTPFKSMTAMSAEAPKRL